jgi:hypothetical protein
VSGFGSIIKLHNDINSLKRRGASCNDNVRFKLRRSACKYDVFLTLSVRLQLSQRTTIVFWSANINLSSS